MSERREGVFWVRHLAGTGWTPGEVDGDMVTVLGNGMPSRLAEVEIGPRIEPPISPTMAGPIIHDAPYTPEPEAPPTVTLPVGPTLFFDGSLRPLTPDSLLYLWRKRLEREADPVLAACADELERTIKAGRKPRKVVRSIETAPTPVGTLTTGSPVYVSGPGVPSFGLADGERATIEYGDGATVTVTAADGTERKP